MAAPWKSTLHGIAWFPNAPDVEKLLATEDDSDLIAAVEDITSYANDVVSTTNPAIAMDGSNPKTAPSPKTKPQHACNKPYSEVEDLSIDLVDLIATCQRHTRCSRSLLSQEEKRQARVSLWVPKTPATSHHHHHREWRTQPHHCKKRLPTK